MVWLRQDLMNLKKLTNTICGSMKINKYSWKSVHYFCRIAHSIPKLLWFDFGGDWFWHFVNDNKIILTNLTCCSRDEFVYATRLTDTVLQWSHIFWTLIMFNNKTTNPEMTILIAKVIIFDNMQHIKFIMIIKN
jgi:hypothetical protein